MDFETAQALHDVAMADDRVQAAEAFKRHLTRLRDWRVVYADDTYLVLRGLPTMKLRFEAHDQGARKVAAWLKTRPEITKVLHPAFEDCPGHDIWKRDFTGAGGLFSVLFDERYTEEQTDRFVDELKLFGIGYSWGGANSLAVPYRIQAMRQGWTHGKGILVRFNIGLEDADDLIADIAQALGKL